MVPYLYSLWVYDEFLPLFLPFCHNLAITRAIYSSSKIFFQNTSKRLKWFLNSYFPVHFSIENNMSSDIYWVCSLNITKYFYNSLLIFGFNTLLSTVLLVALFIHFARWVSILGSTHSGTDSWGNSLGQLSIVTSWPFFAAFYAIIIPFNPFCINNYLTLILITVECN